MIVGVGLEKGYCRVTKAAHLIEGPTLIEKVINGDDRIGAAFADQRGSILRHPHGDQICISHVVTVSWPNAAAIIMGLALGFWEIDRSCHVGSIEIPSASARLLQLAAVSMLPINQLPSMHELNLCQLYDAYKETAVA